MFKFDPEQFKKTFKQKTSGLDLVEDLTSDLISLEPLESKGNIEDDFDQETKQLHSELNEQRKKSQERMRVATDVDYYCTIVFLSRAQRDAFLKAVGWEHHGAPRYINGVTLAKEMGIDIPSEEYKPTKAKPRKK